MEWAREFKMLKPPMCTNRNMTLIKAGSGRSQILPAAIIPELSARQFRITFWMPGADEIHSPLWKEQQRLTGSQSAKNKSGLSRRWCAARAPSAVSLDASPFVHSFSDGGDNRLLELLLIGLPVASCALRCSGAKTCASRSCKLELC